MVLTNIAIQPYVVEKYLSHSGWTSQVEFADRAHMTGKNTATEHPTMTHTAATARRVVSQDFTFWGTKRQQNRCVDNAAMTRADEVADTIESKRRMLHMAVRPGMGPPFRNIHDVLMAAV